MGRGGIGVACAVCSGFSRPSQRHRPPRAQPPPSTCSTVLPAHSSQARGRFAVGGGAGHRRRPRVHDPAAVRRPNSIQKQLAVTVTRIFTRISRGAAKQCVSHEPAADRGHVARGWTLVCRPPQRLTPTTWRTRRGHVPYPKGKELLLLSLSQTPS